MIRVLVGQGDFRLETLVKSIPSFVFAGTLDLSQPSPFDAAADVLIIAAVELDWANFADLPIPVVLLAHSSDIASVTSALRAGIRGVISSDATADEVESAVQAVHAGLIVTTPAMLPQLLPDIELHADELAEPLSHREREVLDLMAEGLSNKLIAQALNISEHTVKTHITSIFVRLGVSSRTEAVSQAIRRGLVML